MKNSNKFVREQSGESNMGRSRGKKGNEQWFKQNLKNKIDNKILLAVSCSYMNFKFLTKALFYNSFKYMQLLILVEFIFGLKT